MTRDTFAEALRKGLGRAMRHVRQHGMDDVADLVLAACLEDQSYDPQCEGGRAAWMIQFFQQSPRHGEFRDAILTRLSTATPSYDLEHLCGLAGEMATNGDNRAREALRTRVLEVARTASASDSAGASLWISLEGEGALLELAECYGARLLADPNDDVPTPIGPAEEDVHLMESLRTHAEQSPAIQAYRTFLANQNEAALRARALDPEVRRAERLAGWKRAFPVEKILQMASNKEGTYAGKYAQFGGRANDEERQRVYDRLLQEPDDDVRVRLLWVFRRALLPQVDEAILAWATGPHHALRAASISAVTGTRDARIHALARTKIASAQILGADKEVLGLFLENYAPSDAGRITSALANLNPDPDEAHALASDLCELVAKHADAAHAGALNWAYEATPCTICRLRIVKLMGSLNLLDASVLEECQFDAEPRIRSLAE